MLQYLFFSSLSAFMPLPIPILPQVLSADARLITLRVTALEEKEIKFK